MTSNTSHSPPAGAADHASETPPKDSLGNLLRRPETGSFIGLVCVFAFFTVFGGETFLSVSGAASWLNIAAELGIIALPVGLLMIAGHLDLSVGSVVPASSMMVAIVSGHFGLPMPIGIACALALGLAVGFLNGYLVVKTDLPSFVVTLATLFAVAGLTLGLSVILAGSTSVALKADPISKMVFGDYINGKFEVVLLWWVAAMLVVEWPTKSSKELPIQPRLVD